MNPTLAASKATQISSIVASSSVQVLGLVPRIFEISRVNICQITSRTNAPVITMTAISRIRIVPDEEKQRHPHAPDMIIGWANGFRTSWKSILGSFENDIYSDNLDKWSGDHCMDPQVVPAILAANRKVARRKSNLTDITATILDEFGVPLGDANKEIEGKPLYHA